MTLFGILNVNKPAGLTSRDVVDRVERLVRPAKAGHAGTLDPLATGVLVICVGQATRLIRTSSGCRRRYRPRFCSAAAARRTTSKAKSCRVRGRRRANASDARSSAAAVCRRHPAAAARPLGDQNRRPAGVRAGPRGRRRWSWPPRTVTIHEIAVRRYEYPELELDIECGSGTYVRSLGRDLGAALGTGAVMSALERTAIGAFRVEDAVATRRSDAGNACRNTCSRRSPPSPICRASTLTEAQLVEIRHGRPIPMPSAASASDAADASAAEWAAVDAAGQLVAILFEKQPGELWPAMNFA